MDRLDAMRAARDKYAAVYRDFILHAPQMPNYLFCFFEGKDKVYYGERIKKYTNFYKDFNCKGRDVVLKLHELIIDKEDYLQYKKAFFIDRDFNPANQHSDTIFETPCYSIENLYVSIDAFRKILNRYLHEKDAGFEKCVNIFQERQMEFHQAVLLFNAWYACLIDIKNATKQETGVSLDDSWHLPHSFVKIELTGVTSNYNEDILLQKYPNALAIKAQALQQKIDIFSNCEKYLTFRGKYELGFLAKFVELLFLAMSKDNDTFKRQYELPKIDFPFNGALVTKDNSRAMDLFSSCADTPQILDDYLRRVTA